MKKYIVLIILSICTLWASAQTRAFVDGETIEFFPVSSVFKEQCQGYDCFYDTNKLIKTLAKAKTAKMKFIGRQYYNIKTLSKQQIEDIKRTIELYHAMGGDF